ncbi:DUF3772 domain-containing protein [Phenylobacterium montanum]|uniref:DUF3772 domain-containing protein n=2 Tax=Phenylobacterium montanum TaxID=2823693 RepID=A0A975IX40_9CAUL|nr:DUF3772 domain-containing protein [Caulobacter sp. S6]
MMLGAAAPAPGPSEPLDVGNAHQTLAHLRDRLPIASRDDQLAAMAAQAAGLESQAQALVAARAHALAALDHGLAQIGPKGRRAPTKAEQQKRAPLLAQRPALVAQVQQAQGLAADAGATYDQIAERRRAGFSARVLQRTDSPVSPSFWNSLAGAGWADLGRLDAAADEAVRAAIEADEPKGLIGLGAGLLFALMVAFPLRVWLRRLGRRKNGDSVHPGFSRTAAAVWVAAIDTGAPTLAVAGLHLGAQWGGLLSPKADAMAGAAVGAAAWISGVLALGRVLAIDPDPGQRLLALPDPAARRIGPPLMVVALVAAAGLLLTRLNYVIGASVAATIAANCVLSLAYAGVAGLILFSFGRSRALPDEPAAPSQAASAWALMSLILTGVILVTLGAVFAGYTTLAALTSGQIFWLSLISAVAYLLLRFVDDLCASLFQPHGRGARLLFALFSLRASAIGQIGLLLSAGLQLLIIIGAASLALTPFGQSGELLFARLAQLGGGVHLGSVTISPTAIAAGLATLMVGVGLAHLVQAWVVRRYLPVTDWDSGLRNSVSTGVGYLGVCLAIICAFAATGLGFKQIALIASALSVGIGFGLQQVVQNFVSGVILLVERPVKVGDWVNIGGVEGDIRRIRVRATEIQAFDRSTVIVPNSDLITKAVQNKTLGEARGRIQLPLAIAKAAEAPKAKALILEAGKAHPQVLETPEPAVYIDGLAAAGTVNLNSYFYVASPRDAYRIRSELYFAILAAFIEGGVSLPTV